MKGSRGILAFVAIAILLAAAPAWSQDEYAKPIDRSICPGRTQIRFGGIAFNITTTGSYIVQFEDVDAQHVKLTVKPVKPTTAPYPMLYVQWETFGPVGLGVSAPDGNTYLLDTETGYAEK